MPTFLTETVIKRVLPWSAFWEQDGFWQTWLPTWLQGIGTMIAALVAWRAYATWRDQDTARRRVVVAERLLRAAHEIRLAIADTRTPWLGPDIELNVKLAMRPGKKSAVKALEESYNQLYDVLIPAKHYGFEAGAMSAIGKVGVAAWKVRRNFRKIEDIEGANFQDDDEDVADVVKRAFPVVFRAYGVEGSNALVGDEFDQELDRNMEIVETALGEVIAGKR